MPLTDKEMLKRLGAGESIATVREAAALTAEGFASWWQSAAARRVPIASGPNKAGVQIRRDERGIPHIHAGSNEDLFFGFGFAMAQDRLFQLDYLRRKAHGRLAEVLGPEALPQDLLARTVGLGRLARAEFDRLAPETRTLLEAFSAGINEAMKHAEDAPAIEFDLLDYRPEPWSPVDCVAIETEFRWYLTGRFPVICMPELARRTLGDGALYRDYLTAETDDECILPRESYPKTGAGQANPEPVGLPSGGPDDGTGSNNWVVSGRHTTTGLPMVASDPHIAFEAVSCWYQVHLSGGSFEVAGMTYVGMPAVMFGRNKHVAWGATNNICSQRDLYQEQTAIEHPGCFLYDGQWEPAGTRQETIAVKGSEPVTKTVLFSRNGPIVTEILPPPANKTGPVALKWLGAYHGGWLTALHGMNRATDADSFLQALRSWHVPTFCVVFADTHGTIGYKATGRIPIRGRSERGYRPGWDPKHQWDGLIPFELMPESIDPQQGWMATANHRVAADDYPLPLAGTWPSGNRGRRIRQLIEERLQRKLSVDDFRAMHQDSLSLRAADCVPKLLLALADHKADHVQGAVRRLQEWDFRSEPDSVPAALFHVFFSFWTEAVAAERFDQQTVPLMLVGIEPIATRLLAGDPNGWFTTTDCKAAIVAAFERAITTLESRFGPNMNEWKWGQLHRAALRHVLSARGELGKLLDQKQVPVRGDMGTVCNTGSGPDWIANSGAGFRMIAVLNPAEHEILTIDGQSQSGHPGSPNYADQFSDWLAGRYQSISLDQ